MRFREKRLIDLCGDTAKTSPLVVWLDLYLWYPYKAESVDLTIYVNDIRYAGDIYVKTVKKDGEPWYIACMKSAVKKNQIGIPVLWDCAEKKEIEKIAFTFSVKYRVGEKTFIQVITKTLPLCLQDPCGDYVIEEYVMPVPTITDWKIMNKFENCAKANQSIATASMKNRANQVITSIVKNESTYKSAEITELMQAILSEQANMQQGISPTQINISLYQNSDKKYLKGAYYQ